jgi:hypothetical protein
MDNSPAQGKFLNELVRKPESGGGTGPVGVSGPVDSNLSQRATGVELSGPSRGAPLAVPSSNPYLQAAEVTTLRDPGAGHGQPLNAGIGFSATTGPAASAGLNPPPAARPEEKRAPLLRPSDNDKYFPQLKRF